MHYCDCKGTMTLQLLQRVFQRMLTINFAADRVNHQPSERISSELVNGYRRNTHNTGFTDGLPIKRDVIVMGNKVIDYMVEFEFVLALESQKIINNTSYPLYPKGY